MGQAGGLGSTIRGPSLISRWLLLKCGLELTAAAAKQMRLSVSVGRSAMWKTTVRWARSSLRCCAQDKKFPEIRTHGSYWQRWVWCKLSKSAVGTLSTLAHPAPHCAPFTEVYISCQLIFCRICKSILSLNVGSLIWRHQMWTVYICV